ncbi:hypothetical protein ATZ36_13670 [Candidatus Endomicrobiellum trichonymphae]|jgi:hypothetical protein|uniref:Uncharacterized protein n=1 Tax=Endomicrobium trichonymphae TaxID=1408204 RepID=A0A1E5IMA1_ENDTX|nr:hypothetical protein ATZ36_13670 [Candidatus Endomicrobium trichonymphae]
MLRGIPTISSETSAKIEKNVNGAKEYTEKAYQLCIVTKINKIETTVADIVSKVNNIQCTIKTKHKIKRPEKCCKWKHGDENNRNKDDIRRDRSKNRHYPLEKMNK